MLSNVFITINKYITLVFSCCAKIKKPHKFLIYKAKFYKVAVGVGVEPTRGS